jgi:hypothetical protein
MITMDSRRWYRPCVDAKDRAERTRHAIMSIVTMLFLVLIAVSTDERGKNTTPEVQAVIPTHTGGLL